jgi:S-adenosylmethionine:tRNA ribosyltransferase-isomerase
MRIDQFDYPFDESLIAYHPLAEREDARLLLAKGLGIPPEDAQVRDLPHCLREGSLMLVNDTQVVPARLLGTRRPHGGKTEIFLIKQLPGDGYLALARPLKALRPGTIIDVGTLEITVLERTSDAGVRVSVRVPGDERKTAVASALAEHGSIPLPPYITRAEEPEDRARYQTVFAKNPGAIAAPTAGLHLTEALFARLRARGVAIHPVTLHVGLGTFQPVTTDDLDQHPMHEEQYEIPEATAQAITDARQEKRPIVAIGTTVVRAVESQALLHDGVVQPGSGSTRLLIQPGFCFQIIDTLLTNFHVPRSTLLSLVCAFGGHQDVLALYKEAIARRYRFFSYGDAMLLQRRRATAQRESSL